MKIVIRKARPPDAEYVSGLICRTLRQSNSGDYPQEELMRLCDLHSPEKMSMIISSRQLFVVEKDGQTAGCAALVICGDEAGTGRVTTVFVDPKFQNSGIGSALMSHLEIAAAEQGLQALYLDSSITAHAFYCKTGYEDICDPEPEPSPEGLYPMMKHLSL